MTLLEIGIYTMIVFIDIFAIVDRICKCKEHCSDAKTLIDGYIKSNEK